MNNATQRLMKEESFLARQNPVSDDLQHALQCTLWIDDHGFIRDSNGPSDGLLGYGLDELKGQHISLLLPDLEHAELLTQNRINPILLYRCRCSIPFRGVDKKGIEQRYIVYMNLLSNHSGQSLSMTIHNHVP
ncbi:MAG: hypothetical protein WBX11_07080 [Thiobacillaceae bacterium]